MKKYFLEDEAIYLKKIDQDDISDEYVEWINDPIINNFMETRFFPHSKKDIENFVNSINNDKNSALFGIFDKNSSKHIGNIKLGPINWIHRRADVSLFIGDNSFSGKGYATMAIKLMVKYGFNILNLHKLVAGVYADNFASKKAFEKNGFNVEGIKKEDCYINHNYIDVYILGKINDN